MNVINSFKRHACLVTATVVLVGQASFTAAQTVLFDFGNDQSFRGLSVPNPDSLGHYWNSFRTGVFYTDLKDINNVATTIDFGISTPVGTDSYNGPAGPTTELSKHQDVLFTDIDQVALGNLGGALEAAFDFIAGPSLPDNRVQFEIQQLDPAKKYNLTFFGSHKHSIDDTTIYSVFSDNTYTTLVGTASLDVQLPGSPHLHNRDTVATIENLSPQADNILYVQFVGSNGHEGYLNDLQLVGVAPAFPGDYSNDGKVDAADYVVWRNNQGTMNMLPNDPHGGTIGPNQYATWRANFGMGTGGGAAIGGNIVVPEPVSAILVVAATIGLSLVRRR